MEASRGPPRVKNKAPGESCLQALKTYVLTFCKLLNKSAQNNYSVRPLTGRSQGSRRQRNDLQTLKSFMNSKAGSERNSRIMCEGIG